ncbi:MAG TPA: hypothetical protein VE620_12415 [Myxococcales bacterium]|nr:hypothetical protein [Myxococcales bacterium]
MGLLDTLVGAAQQPALQDFIRRYEQGAPWDGISHDEAVCRYQQVAGQIPHEDYVAAAEEAFSRLTPEQRAQFGRLLQDRAQQQNVQLPEMGGDGGQVPQDPRSLAMLTSRMRQQQPGIVSQLLGGAGGGMNPLAKAALAGIAAMAVKRMMTAHEGAR